MISNSKKSTEASSPVVGGNSSSASVLSFPLATENKQDASSLFGVSSMFSVPIDNCSFLKGKEYIYIDDEVKRSGSSNKLFSQ
jgi:hypothetical protein